ncbi:MAG: multiheme c-type cytochrome [Thermoanaerobaculia bacterium]
MRAVLILGLILFLAFLVGYVAWPSVINWILPADSRPAPIDFLVETVSDGEFEEIAQSLTTSYPEKFEHVDRLRKAGIRSYEGPKTCLKCHEYAQIENAETGAVKNVDLMQNLLESSHYHFFTTRHPNVYGFKGELADDFPMGKIDRPCPKPGSFSFTAWAEVVEMEDGRTLSEGCGQCHIGGQYQAPLGEMMPAYRTTRAEREAIDCLICHAAAYDMNRKQVVVGADGRGRWDQDRSMLAALSVVTPTGKTCLRCHQHNFGGDIYIDELDPLFMQSQWNLGDARPRIAHPGSKRGTPYSPTWDVHAAQNMACIECHTTQGHLIAKGTHTTTMMANDLPDVEVSCEKCHSAEPHKDDPELAEVYNSHTRRIA